MNAKIRTAPINLNFYKMKTIHFCVQLTCLKKFGNRKYEITTRINLNDCYKYDETSRKLQYSEGGGMGDKTKVNCHSFELRILPDIFATLIKGKCKHINEKNTAVVEVALNEHIFIDGGKLICGKRIWEPRKPRK